MPATLAEQRMAELEKKYGTPQKGTLGYEFTTPEGAVLTVDEAGNFRAKQLPATLTNQYRGRGREQVEALYKYVMQEQPDRICPKIILIAFCPAITKKSRAFSKNEAT